MTRIAVFLTATIVSGNAMAFDLQGHRGARGLAPENTIAAFTRALKIGVTTLELDLAMTKDGILVVSHDYRLNPAHTRGPDEQFLTREGPAIRSLTFEELQRYDVGRIKPGTPYAERFPHQRGADGIRIPALTEVFDLAKRMKADHVRFNIETKLTPTSDSDTPDPEIFAAAVAKTVKDAGLAERVSLQSFDWRTLIAMRSIAPEIERVCLTIEDADEDNVQKNRPGPSPWTAGFDIDDVGGSVPTLVSQAGCAVWSPFFRNVTAEGVAKSRALNLKVIPWTVNDKAEMARLIDLQVDGLISDYPDRLRAVLADKNIPLPPVVTMP